MRLLQQPRRGRGAVSTASPHARFRASQVRHALANIPILCTAYCFHRLKCIADILYGGMCAGAASGGPRGGGGNAEELDARAGGTGPGHHLLHRHHQDGRLRARRDRLGHPRCLRSGERLRVPSPVVDIERQVSGRVHDALPAPIQCRSRAWPKPQPFAHPHAPLLNPVRHG